jgi:DNA-directed RNA polymerase delta subunit
LSWSPETEPPSEENGEEEVLREAHEEENSVFYTEFHTGGFIRLSERRWHSHE